MTAVRILYNLAFPFVLLALLPSFLFRMLKRGKYRHKFGQRFGNLFSARSPKAFAWRMDLGACSQRRRSLDCLEAHSGNEDP